MSTELEANELYCFVKEFPEAIKSISDSSEVLQSLKRLLNESPELLSLYPSSPAVIEVICKAIAQAVRIKETRSLVLDFDNAVDAVIFLCSSFSDISWLTLSPDLVRLACESMTTMLTLYKMEHVFNVVSFVASFLQESFALFAQCVSTQHSIALGSSFACNLPSSLYNTFIEFGIFEEIQNLIRLYTDMSEEDFTNILKVLCSFLRSELVVCSSSLISGSAHFMLLFASQQFSNSFEVQDNLWGLLMILLTNCKEFVEEVTPSALVSAVHSTLTASNCGLCPIVHFLIEYITTSNNIDPPLVVYCFENHPKLLDILVSSLDVSRDRMTAKDRDEVVAVSQLLELFFQDFSPSYSTIRYIVEHRVLEALRQAAIAWPDLCCLSYCTAFRRFLEHFASPKHENATKAFQGSNCLDDAIRVKNEFVKENQLLPFIDLLCNPSTFSSQSIRIAIHHLVMNLLKSVPTDISGEWLNGEFLMSFISGFSRDVKEFPEKMSDFVSLAHLIVHSLKVDQIRILQDQKWHRVVVSDCLISAITSNAAPIQCINFSVYLLQRYIQSFDDATSFITDCNFMQLVSRFAKKYDIINLFCSVILTLSSVDKRASTALYENGFLNDILPFTDRNINDPIIVQSAIHAIGNVLLTNADKVKHEMIDRGFHIVLVEYISRTTDPSLLSACCHVLHIFSLMEHVKYFLIEKKLTLTLLKLIDLQINNNIEVYCQALGLLKPLGFYAATSSDDCRYIFPEKIVKSFARLIKANHCTREESYTAFVFLVSMEDGGRTVKVVEVFQQVLREASRDEFLRLLSLKRATADSVKMITVPVNSKYLSMTLEEQELVASCMEQFIMLPEKRIISCGDLQDGNSETHKSSYTCGSNTSIDGSDNDELLHPFPTFLEGPQLKESTYNELAQLGLDPNTQLFRIERFYCNTYSEYSFSPLNLTPHQYQRLIDRGWYRRGGEGLFRFQQGNNFDVCEWETRVNIAEFDYKRHKSYKKVLKRMPEDRLTIETVPTQFIQEAYDLYNSYQFNRHGFPMVSEEVYHRKCVNSPLRNQSIDGFHYGSFHQLYYLDGTLVAVGVIDVVPNGVLSMYMWYSLDKEVSKYSFGIYSTLKEIEFARNLSKCNLNIKYYYMQGWRHTNSRLNYKVQYEPEEFYCPGIVSDWVLGLDNTMKEIEKAKEEQLLLTKDVDGLPEHNDDFGTSHVRVPGNAFSLDRLAYHAHYGPNEPDIMNIVICLDHQIYMYLGQMLDTYSICDHNRRIVMKYFTGLFFAVGPKLVKNMIVDLKTCLLTGYPVELGPQ